MITASSNAAARKAWSAEICRTARIESPLTAYSQPPTAGPSRSPAVSPSAPAHLASNPRRTAAASQTAT